jgi:hypothetical protein
LSEATSTARHVPTREHAGGTGSSSSKRASSSAPRPLPLQVFDRGDWVRECSVIGLVFLFKSIESTLEAKVKKTKTIVITIIISSPSPCSPSSLLPPLTHCTPLPLYDVWWLLVASCGSTVFVLLCSVETRHERSYNENYTPSRPLWEVKSHLAWSVVRWVTTCEARVLFVLFCLFWFY